MHIIRIRLKSLAHLGLLVGAVAGPPLAAQAGGGPPPTDWTSVDLFWQVHDILADDREPSDTLWDSLFTSTGYAALEARERRSTLLKAALRVAFKPSLRDSIALVAASHPWLTIHLPLIAAAPAQRAQIEQLRRPVGLTTMVDSARGRASEWLPPGTTDRIPIARIAWAVFGSQRGYPDLLLLDPSLFVQHPDQAGMLGHELHHHYRASVARPTQPLGADLAAWALVNVEVEGIAGQVDKRPLLSLDREGLERRYPDGVPGAQYSRDYPAVHAESPRWLRAADLLLAHLFTETDSTARARLASNLHGGLPDNGRAMGSWMADVIQATLGRNALLDVVGDSFGFWRTYQQAALASDRGYPVLSDQAMQAIAELELRYVRAAPAPGDRQDP